ncbi:hypothetical protein GIB67_024088, partial [Kingdonia uniflora]
FLFTRSSISSSRRSLVIRYQPQAIKVIVTKTLNPRLWFFTYSEVFHAKSPVSFLTLY